jgi:hypothetical protein
MEAIGSRLPQHCSFAAATTATAKIAPECLAIQLIEAGERRRLRCPLDAY